MSSTAQPSPDVTNLIRFSYDFRDKAFTGIVSATKSPLEPDVIHEPAFSTDVKPGVFSDGQIAIFDEVSKTWSIVPDYRGQVWFDGVTGVVIEQPGDPATFQPPLSKNPPVQTATDPTALDLTVPPGLSFEQKKNKTDAAVLALINNTATQFTKNYSQNEVLSWTAKEAAARAYVAKENLTESQSNLLNSEYQAGGSIGTLDDLCNSIIVKANLLAKVTGFLAGTRSEAQTQISAAQTDNDLLTVFNNTKTKITSQIAQYVSNSQTQAQPTTN